MAAHGSRPGLIGGFLLLGQVGALAFLLGHCPAAGHYLWSSAVAAALESHHSPARE